MHIQLYVTLYLCLCMSPRLALANGVLTVLYKEPKPLQGAGSANLHANIYPCKDDAE